MAKHFKRANRALKTIRTYLGRVMRDIVRKIKGEAELESVFAHPLMLARRVREQRLASARKEGLFPARARGRMHRQGKAHRPYEFGVKVSLATTLNRSRVVSSSPMPRRCPATPTTVTRSPP
jgi:transposase, IS5 family